MFEGVCEVTVAGVQTADPFTLAAALTGVTADDIDAASVDEAECVVAATQRVINALSARQSRAVTRYTEHVHATRDAERVARQASGAPLPVGQPSPVQEAAAGLAPVLRIAPRTMVTRIHTAATLSDLPRTAALAWAGDVEPYRAAVIARAARDLGHEQLTEFEARLHHADIRDLPGSRVKTRADLIAARLTPHPDPDNPDQDAHGCEADREVRVGPGEPAGLTKWDALLPTDSSLSMWAAVETLAAAYRAGNPDLTVNQSRADALTDLVLSDVQVSTTATLILPTSPAPTAADPTAADPADPAGPTGPADPADPNDPADAAGSAGPAEYADPAESARHAGPADPAGHADPAGSAGPAGRDATTAFSEPTEPGDTEPGEPSGPGEPGAELMSEPTGPGGSGVDQAGTGTSSDPPGSRVIAPLTPPPCSCAGRSRPWVDLLDPLLVSVELGGEVQDRPDPPLQHRYAKIVAHALDVDANPQLARDGDGHVWFVPKPVTSAPIGLLLPAQVNAILADPDTIIRLGAAHPHTRAVEHLDQQTYRPGAALARLVRARDGTCRHPGCATPAGRCDLDHVIAYPQGPTTAANLHSLCRTHHGFKHHGGWSVTMTPDGVCTWTAPNGRSHTTHPHALHDDAA